MSHTLITDRVPQLLTAAQGPDSLIWWDWVSRHRQDIIDKTLEHIYLTGIAVGIGTILSVGLAALALRLRWARPMIMWSTGVLYGIPSLALFGLLVPITGASVLTAEIALVSYCLLVLVQNLVTGIEDIPAQVRDAADGMGYTTGRRLLRIELPLAIPQFITGLRIATVTTIGLVTVAALVGHGGLGDFINDGLKRNFSTPIMVGVVGSIVLAVAADAVFVAIQWISTPWNRRSGR